MAQRRARPSGRTRLMLRGLGAVALAMAGLGAGFAAEGPDPAETVHTARIERVFQLLQEARRASEAQRYLEARALLQEAVAMQPGNRSLQLELERVEILAGMRPAPAAQADDAQSVARQLTLAEIRVALQRAELQLAEGLYDRAAATLETARGLLETQPDPDAGDALRQLERLLAAAVAGDATGREQAARAERQAAQERALQLSQVEQAERRSVLQQRIERILAVKQRGHYELALAQARQLVSDYPGQAQPEALFNALTKLAYEQRKATREQEQVYRTQEINERIHRALIPEGFDGRPIFPGDWRERSGRGSGLEEVVTVPPWQEALLNRLGQRLTVDFVDIDPVEALEFVANRTGINLVIANDVRTAANPTVSLRAANMRVDHIVNWLTRQIDTDWQLAKQAVWVGGDADDEPVIRVYDITEAVFAAPELAGPQLDAFQLGGSTGGGGGFDLFGGAGFDDGGGGVAPEDLVDLILEAVDPEAWDNPDYSIGVRSETYLLVRASPRLHVLVREFLDSQLGVNRTLVHAELRWLEVYDEYLEEIGIDWRNGADTLLSLVGTGIGSGGAQRSYSAADIAAQVVNRLPETALAIAPSLVNSGATLQLMYLGGTTLSAMLTAVERKNKGRVVAGMDLTCMSGQRAHAMFVDQVAYIADYNVETGGGAGTLDPVIETVNVGSILDIQPLVSADRKYVTMDLRPMTSTVNFFVETLSVVTTVANAAVVLSYPIELPNLRIQSVGTRVIIPDGGSILVGGFTEALDQDSVSTVPFLGHIPYLGRLFGKRGRYSRNSELFLTMTVDIILYDEEEGLQ